jgi:hypothetical protein
MSYTPKTRDTVSVKDFGAKGDGSTDDTPAIQAAIASATSTTPPRAVIFPAGNYKITATNVLCPPANTTGLHFIGQGPQATTITLTNTGATDFWFYDNGSAAPTNASLIYPTYENMGFIGAASGSGKVNGFRLYGTGNGYPSQKFTFINCYGQSVNIFLDCQGSTNASENKIISCRFSGCATLLRINNPQAVNHFITNTDFESYTGSIIIIQDGGQVTWLGGSTVTSSSNTTFIVEATAPAGGLTGTCKFVEVRPELNSNTSGIISSTGSNNSAQYIFDSCSFRVATGGTRNSIVAGGTCIQMRIRFQNCPFNANHLITWVAGSTNFWFNTQGWAELEFDGCTGITKNSITYDAFSLGYTRIKNSRDGTLDWEGGRLGLVQGPVPTPATKKIASGWIYYWSDATFNTDGSLSTVVIPVGSVIKSIFVRKLAGGGSTANYQLELVDGAGTRLTVPAYATGSATSTLGQQQLQHDIVLNNIMKRVTNATTGTVTVRAVSGSQGVGVAQTMLDGDYFLVEYV